MTLKINLGCGLRKEDGFVGIDKDPNVNPDYLLDLEKDKLPFENNSVDHVKSIHFFEHLNDGFIPLMVEIYRVCKNDAILEVIVPYFRSEIFYTDLTHKRFFSASSFNHFDKKYCDWNRETYNSSTGIAYEYDVNFQIIEYTFTINEEYKDDVKEKLNLFEEGKITQEKLWRWYHDTNNVITELHFKIKINKFF